MFYNILYPLHTQISFFNIFRYITFRTIWGSITAFLIFYITAPYFIKKLREYQIGQHIQEDGPKTHHKKKGTPTMGGGLILLSIFLSSFLWLDLTNFYVQMLLVVTLLFGLIGFVDDYIMIVKKRNKGFSAKVKFTLQTLAALIVVVAIYRNPDFDSRIIVPFFKNVKIDLSYFYILFASLVIVGASNAVNLTDGLDGLAIGPIITVCITYMVFAYVIGNYKLANYLNFSYIEGCGELTIFCGVIVGAGVGFLWFNSFPAEIFMGDTGSIPLGAMIGTIAIITKQEILLVISGGLFVLEAISVMLQVSIFRITKGKKLFKMAPIHHHFELKGWAEPKIIVRFWIVSIFFALLAISTLKIR